MKEFDFFKLNKDLTPEKGDLLISEPFMPDPNFSRTVVLLCEHDENGSFGFVLNQQSSVCLDELIDKVKNFNEPVFIGGPVQQDTVHVLHRNSTLKDSSNQVKGDIYWGGDFEKILTNINENALVKKDYKFFVGYSGWAAGQLKSEIEANSWIIYKHTSVHHILDLPHSELWKAVLKDLGGRFKLMSNYPVDPRLN